MYRRAYHARLVECLVDDYPAVQHALGESAFDDLCRGYIAAFPSTGPNLNHFGRRMGAFVREGVPEPFPLRAFVADLAALEWAIVEVIHAASAPPLTADGLRDVPPDAWGALRLEATPALRLLRFDHPVNAYFQAFRDDEAPAVPAASPSATVVYRSESMLWRMDLTPPMTEVLSALVAGEPLGQALSRAEAGLAHLDEAAIGSTVTTWFREVGRPRSVRPRGWVAPRATLAVASIDGQLATASSRGIVRPAAAERAYTGSSSKSCRQPSRRAVQSMSDGWKLGRKYSK